MRVWGTVYKKLSEGPEDMILVVFQASAVYGSREGFYAKCSGPFRKDFVGVYRNTQAHKAKSHMNVAKLSTRLQGL